MLLLIFVDPKYIKALAQVRLLIRLICFLGKSIIYSHCSYVTPVVWIMILLSRTSYHLRRHERAQSALHREERSDNTLEPLNGMELENPHDIGASSHYSK